MIGGSQYVLQPQTYLDFKWSQLNIQVFTVSVSSPFHVIVIICSLDEANDVQKCKKMLPRTLSELF